MAPLLLALAVSALIFSAARMEPSFAGDVTIARAVQSAAPGTAWASRVSTIVTAPGKYVLMTLAVALAFAISGWRAALVVIVVIAAEQWLGEASKQLAARPRPSRDLIAVTGSPSGFSFPSTSMTLMAVTCGAVALIGLRSRLTWARAVGVISLVPLVLMALARVTLGAHWPSDVVLTTVICLAWVWAGLRVARA
ncbi:MAG: phosphatase PAP2 family protein [Acidobacteria bacterium]|nr:phosphatase PAP2 family protein [Acidobacteriota bacterium]